MNKTLKTWLPAIIGVGVYLMIEKSPPGGRKISTFESREELASYLEGEVANLDILRKHKRGELSSPLPMTIEEVDDAISRSVESVKFYTKALDDWEG